MPDQEPATIRERILNIISLANGIYTTTEKPVASIRREAVAALALLDTSERGITGGIVTGSDAGPSYTYGDFRLVLDPAPRGDDA